MMNYRHSHSRSFVLEALLTGLMGGNMDQLIEDFLDPDAKLKRQCKALGIEWPEPEPAKKPEPVVFRGRGIVRRGSK